MTQFIKIYTASKKKEQKRNAAVPGCDCGLRRGYGEKKKEKEDKLRKPLQRQTARPAELKGKQHNPRDQPKTTSLNQTKNTTGKNRH